MSAFVRSTHWLAADGARHSLWGLLCVAVLLGAWGAWCGLARVGLYEVTDTARLETDQAVHPVEAAVAGRIAATHLSVGQEVQVDDVLIDLDAEAQRLQGEEERTRLTALARQLVALGDEIAAEEQALSAARQAGRIALDEAGARLREAEATARFAEENAERSARLHARGLVAQVEMLRARAEAHTRRAAADSLQFGGDRVAREQQTRERDRQAHLERLRREVTRLQGEAATAEATIKRLAYEINRHHIRAPVAGRVGEVANLRIGTVVRAGDRLGAIVPPGGLRVVATFPPPAALGRIQPGQPARLRLEAFPWAQYGSIAATVVQVASEVRDGRVRVELTAQPDPVSPIPLQHGLPGTVEVEVERVTPATLVLRLAGKLLANNTASHAPAAQTRVVGESRPAL